MALAHGGQALCSETTLGVVEEPPKTLDLGGAGGKGVRGDTDRIGAKPALGLLTNVLANQYALGLTAVERPVPAGGRGGLVCAHCGFASAHERAFYCPKCGMRLLRG